LSFDFAGVGRGNWKWVPTKVPNSGQNHRTSCGLFRIKFMVGSLLRMAMVWWLKLIPIRGPFSLSITSGYMEGHPYDFFTLIFTHIPNLVRGSFSS